MPGNCEPLKGVLCCLRMKLKIGYVDKPCRIRKSLPRREPAPGLRTLPTQGISPQIDTGRIAGTNLGRI
jgi:hypothetical protein